MTTTSPDTGAARPTASAERRGFFPGHPPGLGVLFFTELWERFSFYGMRALLIFYLTQHFLFTDAEAYAIYGSYTALVYIGPLFGGLLADRLIGARRAVAIGAILLACGHFTMALEGPQAIAIADPALGEEIHRDATALQLLFLALALIIMGEAFLKANISTMVGRLYGERDPRRDAGFTLFYMGINIGAAAATLICGYLGQRYGWRYGFGLAGFGMLSGLVVFLFGMRGLQGIGDPPDPETLKKRFMRILSLENALYLLIPAGIAASWALLQAPQLVGGALAVIGLASGLGLVGFALFRCPPEARDRLLVAMVLMMFAIVFFALFEQAGSSLNLFTDRNVDRVVFGIEIEAAQLQSLNPLFIIVLAPLFSALWLVLGRIGREPSTPMKFALGLVQTGLGFGALVIGGRLASEQANVALIWLVAAYFLHTTGELSLSPIGLSMVTKLSLPHVVGLTMGVWFLAVAAAQYIAATLASRASIGVAPDGWVDPGAALSSYLDLFGMLGIAGVVAGLLLVVLTPILKRRMHGAD